MVLKEGKSVKVKVSFLRKNYNRRFKFARRKERKKGMVI